MTIALSILVMAVLFVALAGGLLVAERFLVNYGTCAIDINDGERVLEVEGGQTLLSALLDAEISIPSACSGRGSCGYCKVLVQDGGGQVLPTETPFFSRQEMRSGWRLACQVRIRRDIRMQVPDFLDVISEMVRSGRIDRSRRWKFSIKGEENEASNDLD